MSASIELHMIDQTKASSEADKLGICHTDDECSLMYATILQSVKDPALAMLAEELKTAVPEIKKAYDADPTGWYTGYHFGWGMAVRNLLRQKGYGEEYFGVHNLDDIYVALVVDALGLKGVQP